LTDPVEEALVPLSPSRVSDFKNCPQLFKFRVVDHLPEPADILSTRGTLIHAALERLLHLEPAKRNLDSARRLMREAWVELKDLDEFKDLDLDEQVEAEWLLESELLLVNYFSLEVPAEVTPHETEWWVEHTSDLMHLRGIIDRAEVTGAGDWILTDYKTGRSPSDTYALGSFFGLKFYALVLWRTLGKMPARLRLFHLQAPEVLTLVPTEQMLEGLERQLDAIARAILRAYEKDDWRPRPGPLCAWCPHKPICPAFAGTETS